MEVELQILKHLARDAHPTVAIVDEYCAEYKNLFKEVRNYECFKYLHVGIMAPLPRKSLPEIALIGKSKLSPVVTSLYRQFRLVGRAIKKAQIQQD